MYYGAKNRDGLGQLYSAMQYQQQLRLQKEAEAERKRQLEEQRRQQREANKHSAFGDTLKLVGTIGGAAVGSFTPVGPVGGAAIGSTLADATMAFAPNVGGTQPGADNPYYTPTTDTQKALTAVNAGLQFYSAYEADKIAKERALATADAKARSAEKLRTTDFQTAQSYVTSGFDAQQGFEGLQGTEYEAMPSLARDLKDSGKYSFLKDEDFLMIAAGEADNYYKFGPTLETMTLRGTNMLYEALAQPDATAQSVLADLDAGEAPWVKDFKRLPLPAQTAAKADLMKQSRATLAAANAAQKEKAGKVAEDLMDRAKAGLDRVNKRVEQIVKDEAQPPPGMTQQDFLGNWAADPSKMLTMLQVSGTQDPVEQYLAMQRVYGGQDTMILSAFPEDQRKIISGRLDTLGLAPQTAAQEKPAPEVGEGDLTKRVEATNNSNVESQAEDSAKEPVDRTGLVSLNVAEAAEDAPKTREETEAEAEKISAKQIGMGSRAISTGQSTDDTEPAPTESEQFLKNLYLGRDPQSGEMSQELALRRDPRPETKIGSRPDDLRTALTDEQRRNVAEEQRNQALGEAANEDPPRPESALNRMYEDQSVQKEQQASIAAAQTPVSPSVTNLISESMNNAKAALGKKPDPAPAADLTELRAPEVPRPPLAQEDIAYAEPDPEPRNPEDNERVDPALRESRVEALNVVKELNNAFTDLRQKVENSMGQDFDSLNELSPVELRYELNAKQREIDNLTARFDELESGPLVTKEASGEELTEALREYDNIRQSGGRILTELRLMQGERLVDPVIENKVKKLTERYPELSDAKGGVRRRSAARTYYETEMRLAGGLNGMLSEINDRLADTDAFAKAGRIEQAQLEYAKAMHLIEEGLDKYRGANYGEN